MVCTAGVTSTRGYPTFTCHGFSGGTSGSPVVPGAPGQHATLLGVIGGLHQGGCDEAVSFTSPLGPEAEALVERAAAGRRPDVLPAPGPDGC